MKREELEADLSKLLACYGPTFTPVSHGLIQGILAVFDALREERDTLAKAVENMLAYWKKYEIPPRSLDDRLYRVALSEALAAYRKDS